jgi:hypothetical protein
MLNDKVRGFLIAVGLCFAAVSGAAAQAEPTPPTDTQDTNYDDQMLCRFVIFADGGGWISDSNCEVNFQPLWHDPDPGELANTAGVGGYYWATAYQDNASGSRREAVRQFWFYPWNTYPDDARKPKGLGVTFRPNGWDDDGNVTRWVAEDAYPVGFTPSPKLHTASSESYAHGCAKLYPGPDAPQPDAQQPHVELISITDAPCVWAREHIQDSPHSVPPGCE